MQQWTQATCKVSFYRWFYLSDLTELGTLAQESCLIFQQVSSNKNKLTLPSNCSHRIHTQYWFKVIGLPSEIGADRKFSRGSLLTSKHVGVLSTLKDMFIPPLKTKSHAQGKRKSEHLLSNHQCVQSVFCHHSFVSIDAYYTTVSVWAVLQFALYILSLAHLHVHSIDQLFFVYSSKHLIQGQFFSCQQRPIHSDL